MYQQGKKQLRRTKAMETTNKKKEPVNGKFTGNNRTRIVLTFNKLKHGKDT